MVVVAVVVVVVVLSVKFREFILEGGGWGVCFLPFSPSGCGRVFVSLGLKLEDAIIL